MSIGHEDSHNFIRKNTIVGNELDGVYWREETEAMAAHDVSSKLTRLATRKAECSL